MIAVPGRPRDSEIVIDRYPHSEFGLIPHRIHASQAHSAVTADKKTRPCTDKREQISRSGGHIGRILISSGIWMCVLRIYARACVCCVGAVWVLSENPRLWRYKYKMSHWGHGHNHHHHHCCICPLYGTGYSCRSWVCCCSGCVLRRHCHTRVVWRNWWYHSSYRNMVAWA